MARHCNLSLFISAFALLAGCGIRSGLPIGDAGVDAATGEGTAGSGSGEAEADSGILCGNGVIEGKEQCDGDELGGETCLTLGEGDGELHCGPGCYFDVSMCAPKWPTPVPGGYGSAPPAPVAPILPFDAGTGDAAGIITDIINAFLDAGTADGGAAGGGLFGGGNQGAGNQDGGNQGGGNNQDGGNSGAQGG